MTYLKSIRRRLLWHLKTVWNIFITLAYGTSLRPRFICCYFLLIKNDNDPYFFHSVRFLYSYHIANDFILSPHTLPTFANVTFISGLAIILQFNRCQKLFPRSWLFSASYNIPRSVSECDCSRFDEGSSFSIFDLFWISIWSS